MRVYCVIILLCLAAIMLLYRDKQQNVVGTETPDVVTKSRPSSEASGSPVADKQLFLPFTASKLEECPRYKGKFTETPHGKTRDCWWHVRDDQSHVSIMVKDYGDGRLQCFSVGYRTENWEDKAPQTVDVAIIEKLLEPIAEMMPDPEESRKSLLTLGHAIQAYPATIMFSGMYIDVHTTRQIDSTWYIIANALPSHETAGK